MATAIIPRWRKAKPKDYNLKFEQLYEKMDEVGSGVYGTVYMARRRSDGLMVALKVTDVDSEGILPTTIKEVTILRNCAGHPHLVNLLDVRLCFLSMKHYMVMELCETDLEIYARSQALDGGIPPPVVREFIRQILSALQFMHAKDINHRDLKPTNVLLKLVDGKPVVKLADFGLSKFQSFSSRNSTPESCTMLYRAPEILFGMTRYYCASDIWSAGCIFAELFRSAPMFEAENSSLLQEELFRKLGTPNNETVEHYANAGLHLASQWPENKLSYYVPDLNAAGVDLLKRMLCYNAQNRICAKQALAHKYFMDDEKEE